MFDHTYASIARQSVAMYAATESFMDMFARPETFRSADTRVHHVTRGRKKRRRAPSAGDSVPVKRHFRTPRGPNTGKRRVIVDSYKRGKPAKRPRRRKR